MSGDEWCHQSTQCACIDGTCRECQSTWDPIEGRPKTVPVGHLYKRMQTTGTGYKCLPDTVRVCVCVVGGWGVGGGRGCLRDRCHVQDNRKL